MDLNLFIANIVGCAILEVMCGVILPEGKMRKFVLSIVGIYLFYAVVFPITSFVSVL